MIDLRSDTVTRPTPAMLERMWSARIGDDVFGDDESVNSLQRRAAEMFGREAALFCPSGTMTNQIAIQLHTRPGDEVICAEDAHVYRYEGGGIAANAGVSVRLLKGDRGRFTGEDVRANVNRREDPHQPHTRLVVIENTAMRGGGTCWDLGEIERIRTACDDAGLALHLDGARLFNALVARGGTPVAYGALFDTISVCLSKGLGAPVGSLLIGDAAAIAQARRHRKRLGGGMRQAGFLAAAGEYALEAHVGRLVDDHRRAHTFADALTELPFVQAVVPPETNLVFFSVSDATVAERLVRHLAERDVLVAAVGPATVRAVFHLDVDDDGLDRALEALRSFR